MKTTTLLTNNKAAMLKFRNKVANEIHDFESNGYDFVASAVLGNVFVRSYIHRRNKSVLAVEIDFANQAATIRVNNKLKKVIV